MPEHLPLAAPLVSSSRRAGGSGSSPLPDRGSYRGHADALLASFAPAAASAAEVADGIDPSLVFKLRVGSSVYDALRRADIGDIVGEGSDWTYFVLMEPDDTERLTALLTEYASVDDGQTFDHTKELRDLLTRIDGIEPFGPDDRRDPEVVDGGEVRIHLWPADSDSEAQRRLEIVRAQVGDGQDGSSVLAVSTARDTVVVAARVSESALNRLLRLSVVEHIDRPLSSPIDSGLVERYEASITIPPFAGSPIGVLDDGIPTSCAVLTNIVVAREEFPDRDWLPSGPHGAAVASLAAFYDFEGPIRSNVELRAPHPIVQARVLEAGREPADVVMHDSVEAAIRCLNKDHAVRVFNLSFGRRRGARLPTELEAVLDSLVRELDVVVIVSAGNLTLDDMKAMGVQAKDYPDYFSHPDAIFLAPSGAANVLSVGSVAHYDEPAFQGYQSLAQAEEPSPFTRPGPESSGGPRIDAAHWGGNWAIHPNPAIRDVLERDPGLTTVTGSLEPGQQLETGRFGTSFAAPRVAFVAAEIQTKFPDASNNLIRALTLMSCTPATPSRVTNEFFRTAAGSGRPDPDRAVTSDRDRVVLTHDNQLFVDTTVIYPVPIPEQFATGRWKRSIRVALAFDPPVRRARRDYTAGKMTLTMLRAVSAEAALEMFQRQPSPQARKKDPTLVAIGVPEDRRRLKLSPTMTDQGRATAQLAEWRTQVMRPDDGTEYFLAVTHWRAPWAGDDFYSSQRFGIAVELRAIGKPDLELYSLVQAALQGQAAASARVRARA